MARRLSTAFAPQRSAVRALALRAARMFRHARDTHGSDRPRPLPLQRAPCCVAFKPHDEHAAMPRGSPADPILVSAAAQIKM
jgi:hypothetical protein